MKIYAVQVLLVLLVLAGVALLIVDYSNREAKCAARGMTAYATACVDKNGVLYRP